MNIMKLVLLITIAAITNYACINKITNKSGLLNSLDNLCENIESIQDIQNFSKLSNIILYKNEILIKNIKDLPIVP